MEPQRAKDILASIERGKPLADIHVYGNKGRMWSKTACITELDVHKGKCNPRLASNYCTPAEIGCPDCLEMLRKVAALETCCQCGCTNEYKLCTTCRCK